MIAGANPVGRQKSGIHVSSGGLTRRDHVCSNGSGSHMTRGSYTPRDHDDFRSREAEEVEGEDDDVVDGLWWGAQWWRTKKGNAAESKEKPKQRQQQQQQQVEQQPREDDFINHAGSGANDGYNGHSPFSYVALFADGLGLLRGEGLKTWDRDDAAGEALTASKKDGASLVWGTSPTVATGEADKERSESACEKRSADEHEPRVVAIDDSVHGSPTVGATTTCVDRTSGTHHSCGSCASIIENTWGPVGQDFGGDRFEDFVEQGITEGAVDAANVDGLRDEGNITEEARLTRETRARDENSDVSRDEVASSSRPDAGDHESNHQHRPDLELDPKYDETRVVEWIRRGTLFYEKDEDILFGPGGLLRFFRQIYPVYFDIEQHDGDDGGGMVYLQGQAAAGLLDSALESLDHGLHVCLQHDFQPHHFIMLRLVVRCSRESDIAAPDPVDLTIYGPGDISLAALRNIADGCGCVGHQLQGGILSLSGVPDQQAVASSVAGLCPSRKFAPAPIDASDSDFKVLQLWGLRHCVAAAGARVTGVVQQRMCQPLGMLGCDVLELVCDGLTRFRGKRGVDKVAQTAEDGWHEIAIDTGKTEVADAFFKEIFSFIRDRLPFFRTVKITDPSMMRALASNEKIAAIIAQAKAISQVSVVVCWMTTESLFLVWSDRAMAAGTEGVENVCNVLRDTMKTLEEGEVCIAVPDWLLALGTYGVADVVEVIESDDGGKARIRFDWPLEFKRMSGTVDTCLRMDGCHIRGRTIKNKRRDVQQNLETQVRELSRRRSDTKIPACLEATPYVQTAEAERLRSNILTAGYVEDSKLSRFSSIFQGAGEENGEKIGDGADIVASTIYPAVDSPRDSATACPPAGTTSNSILHSSIDEVATGADTTAPIPVAGKCTFPAAPCMDQGEHRGQEDELAMPAVEGCNPAAAPFYPSTERKADDGLTTSDDCDDGAGDDGRSVDEVPCSQQPQPTLTTSQPPPTSPNHQKPRRHQQQQEQLHQQEHRFKIQQQQQQMQLQQRHHEKHDQQQVQMQLQIRQQQQQQQMQQQMQMQQHQQLQRQQHLQQQLQLQQQQQQQQQQQVQHHKLQQQQVQHQQQHHQHGFVPGAYGSGSLDRAARSSGYGNSSSGSIIPAGGMQNTPRGAAWGQGPSPAGLHPGAAYAYAPGGQGMAVGPPHVSTSHNHHMAYGGGGYHVNTHIRVGQGRGYLAVPQNGQPCTGQYCSGCTTGVVSGGGTRTCNDD